MSTSRINLPGMSDVFCSDADLLLFDPVSYWLGDDDAERAVSHVENASSTTVVVLVGHTWGRTTMCSFPMTIQNDYFLTKLLF